MTSEVKGFQKHSDHQLFHDGKGETMQSTSQANQPYL
ncbi:hypothetical protein FOTG_17822 [Fusarium oxysporum f. sp. vasinfectum 25433]|uniref:Uncharacterized protein n=1 Tax=Fusarium oxysporum f. sp. vasinfectum 25433 TaxID=1089449 RepID=X0KJR5_FUSOX|nr:hypothetical protein FOTG_17822 [Fusarium oxysporum f. sp. vasinfectum 25433]